MSSLEEEVKQAQKRKHTEYCDPDYVNMEEPASKYQRGCFKGTSPTSLLNEDDKRRKYKKLCDIISREFQREIVFRNEQLERIDERLDEALKLLDRLRYAIVADYYRKEELDLTPADESIVRGPQTLFDEEPCGIQKPLHPAIRKLVSKKPKIHNEIHGACPTDHTLQTAKLTTDKKQEEAMRDGIPPNTSKEKTSQLVKKSFQEIKQKEATSNAAQVANPLRPIAAKSLNAARLNNKTRVLIVVGNTSKYIGSDVERDHRPHKPLSYKWLIYVQAKDSVPLERFLRKVRFHLHSSYKPNEVVDICSPPFQLSRRGWGEFPVRIQLFFNEAFQQKPIQLVHNLVLDKTLSGIQTLGAETLVEIWLRLGLIEKPHATSSTSGSAKKVATIGENSTDSIQQSPSECEPGKSIQRSIKFANPTTLVENLDCKKESGRKSVGAKSNEIKLSDGNNHTTNHITADLPNGNPFVESALLSSMQETQIEQSSREQKYSASACENLRSHEIKGKSPSHNKTTPSIITTNPPLTTKKELLTRKLVQLIDTDGNVKFLQMLVGGTATSGSSKSISTVPMNTAMENGHSLGSVQSQGVTQRTAPASDSKATTKPDENQHTDKKTTKLEGNKFMKSNIQTDTNLSFKHLNPPVNNNSNSKQTKNTIFLKEGKIYIVDPIQVKLKQQQKKQVSLLKPQSSLIKQNIPQRIPTIRDHDYVSGPVIQPVFEGDAERGWELFSPELSSQNRSLVMKKNSQPHTMTMPPRVHLGLRETRALANNLSELTQKKHLALEQQFLAQRFTNCRQAVEYLLRRFPLVTGLPRNDSTPEDVIPFLHNSSQYFDELPAVKQRALEWLRAKTIAKALRAHKNLQKLSEHPLHASADALWTTREIIIFARHHAYTPALKNFNNTKNKSSETCLTDLIKCELKNAKEIPYETLTKNTCIYKWIESVSNDSAIHKNDAIAGNDDLVDVVSTNQCPPENRGRTLNRGRNKTALKFSMIQDIMYLSYPDGLENPFELVSDICKDIGLHLELEELSLGVIQPVSQTLLAVCLRFFIEKLLRIALGFKAQKYSTTESLSSKENACNYINPQDIEKVIGAISEFDFLSNRHLGT